MAEITSKITFGMATVGRKVFRAPSVCIHECVNIQSAFLVISYDMWSSVFPLLKKDKPVINHPLKNLYIFFLPLQKKKKKEYCGYRKQNIKNGEKLNSKWSILRYHDQNDIES